MATTPSTPTEQPGPEVREGVWISPEGLRAEIVREGGQWRSYVYLTRTGGIPTVIDHPDEADLAEGIAKLEAQGWTYAPGRRPDGPRTPAQATAQQWSPASVIGALVLGVVIVLVGIAILS